MTLEASNEARHATLSRKQFAEPKSLSNEMTPENWTL